MAAASPNTNRPQSTLAKPKKRSERWLGTRARRMGLRIERSRCLNVEPVRLFWLCIAGMGFILRDATLQEIEAFFSVDAATQQVAIEIAGILEITSRVEIDNPDSFVRFDIAQRIQAVMQKAMLAGMSADKLEPILAELRETALIGPKREAA
jgi:hypothetical protein